MGEAGARRCTRYFPCLVRAGARATSSRSGSARMGWPLMAACAARAAAGAAPLHRWACCADAAACRSLLRSYRAEPRDAIAKRWTPCGVSSSISHTSAVPLTCSLLNSWASFVRQALARYVQRRQLWSTLQLASHFCNLPSQAVGLSAAAHLHVPFTAMVCKAAL